MTRSGRRSAVPVRQPRPGRAGGRDGHRLRPGRVRGGRLRRGRVPGRRRPARRRGAGQPRLRQPGRGGGPASRGDGAGPGLRRRHRRAAVGPPGRPGRKGVRPGHDQRDAGPGPGQRPRDWRAERGVPPRPDRGDPAAGRLGRRDHLQLRDQPVHRPARRVRRVLPCPAPRRPPGHLRHPRRRRPHPGPADRARRPGRLHRRDGLLRRVPRQPDPGRVHRLSPSPRPIRSPTACTPRSSARPGPDPCQSRARECGSRR